MKYTNQMKKWCEQWKADKRIVCVEYRHMGMEGAALMKEAIIDFHDDTYLVIFMIEPEKLRIIGWEEIVTLQLASINKEEKES